MNNQVGHIADEIRCQAQIKQHIADIEQHLSWVLSM
uniref:Kch3 n=1 Tax=Arundo donax TaxID=35708 RepID=A0A0A9GMT9_ARUDO